MNHGSLFSGIGGFDLAAERVGFKNIFQVEIDKFCQKVLTKNFPNVKKYLDIHNVTVDNYGNLLYIEDKNGDVFMAQKRLTKYDKAVTIYDSGLSIAECAEFFEISRQAMHKILGRRGCKFRDNKKFSEDNHFYRGCLEDKTKKRRVEHLLEKAIKKGILTQKTHCEECGNPQQFKDGKSGIQAHHSDYDKPLEVRWLCQKCHHNWHINNRAINETDEDKKGSPTGMADVITMGFP